MGSPSANGVVRTVNYDAASRIKEYTHAGTGTVPSPASLNQTFGYDDLDRLTSYSGNGSNQTYAYDASGNRIKAGFGANSYTTTTGIMIRRPVVIYSPIRSASMAV
nr:hypothetical protein [Massilia sp. DJPM01]